MTQNIVLRRFKDGHVLHFVSLLFVGLLILSCFVSAFSPVSLFTSAIASASSVQMVSNEAELDKAVTNASGSTVIALTNDITLTNQLLISATKEIILTSNTNGAKFFKLIGADNKSTIFVERNGILRVDGIIVTHNIASAGNGITVRDTGKLVMSAGEISGNTGVDKNGEAILGFDMAVGGGVYNMGTFEMSGGVIANNTSAGHGGGVYTLSTFKLWDGVIANNSAKHVGGGVYIYGSLTMSNGSIINNTATSGGGVYFSGDMLTMHSGEISGNTATKEGGGVYVTRNPFKLYGGKISDNQAINGGGIYVTPKQNLLVFDGAQFSNNQASKSYNRNPLDNDVYLSTISKEVTWTTPFTQGYNNYDIGGDTEGRQNLTRYMILIGFFILGFVLVNEFI